MMTSLLVSDQNIGFIMWNEEYNIFDDLNEEDSDFEFADDFSDVALDFDVEEDVEDEAFDEDDLYDDEN